MSVRAISWVWEHSTAEGAARLVLLAIADCANDLGESAYPSIATLAHKTRADARTVQRAIGDLEVAGELRVNRASGPRGTNVYSLTFTPGDTPPPARDHPRRETTGTTPPPLAPRRKNPRRGATRTVIEPSVEDQNLPTPSVSAHPNSGRIVAAWIDGHPQRPPDRLVGQVAGIVGTLLRDDGCSAEEVRAALGEMDRKGLHPSTLPSLVHAARSRHDEPPPSRTQTILGAAMQRAVVADGTA